MTGYVLTMMHGLSGSPGNTCSSRMQADGAHHQNFWLLSRRAQLDASAFTRLTLQDLHACSQQDSVFGYDMLY